MTTPLIKWAGGKRQLLPQIMPLIGKIPEGSRYFEPFFGGGAVFFALEPDSAHINDFNPALANLYTAVRDDPLMLHALLKSTEDLYNSSSSDERKEMYRLSREKFNEPNGRMGVEGAARLIFLNKTCYNGLYRENKQGSFNVPWGKKEYVSLVDMENLLCANRALMRATITSFDFERACDSAEKGDVVFFDSPYDMTFDNYLGSGFSEHDHRRLARLFGRLTDMEVRCVLTNSDTPLIRELYEEYKMIEVPVKRMINCDAKGRTGREVIVTNEVRI